MPSDVQKLSCRRLLHDTKWWLWHLDLMQAERCSRAESKGAQGGRPPGPGSKVQTSWVFATIPRQDSSGGVWMIDTVAASVCLSISGPLVHLDILRLASNCSAFLLSLSLTVELSRHPSPPGNFFFVENFSDVCQNNGHLLWGNYYGFYVDADPPDPKKASDDLGVIGWWGQNKFRHFFQLYCQWSAGKLSNCHLNFKGVHPVEVKTRKSRSQ